MKYFIWTFALILTLNVGIKSQVYYPFPTEKANWNIYLLATCAEAPPDTFLLRYAIHGDTTINETLYKKLCLESGDTLSPKIVSIGGIRELNKKIYFYGKDFIGLTHDEEILLYDFTKQIGDTIKHESYRNFSSVILGIDSILIDDNYRKRYQVDNHRMYHNPDYIVEGIGSVLNGLLGHITSVPTCGYHYWEHICFREEGKVKYLNPSFSECYPKNLFTSVIQKYFEENIVIFPTVIDKVLTIQNNTNHNDLVVKLVDLYGRILKQAFLTDIRTIMEIPYASGIFNVVITYQNGAIIKSEKIIVK